MPSKRAVLVALAAAGIVAIAFHFLSADRDANEKSSPADVPLDSSALPKPAVAPSPAAPAPHGVRLLRPRGVARSRSVRVVVTRTEPILQDVAVYIDGIEARRIEEGDYELVRRYATAGPKTLDVLCLPMSGKNKPLAWGRFAFRIDEDVERSAAILKKQRAHLSASRGARTHAVIAALVDPHPDLAQDVAQFVATAMEPYMLRVGFRALRSQARVESYDFAVSQLTDIEHERGATDLLYTLLGPETFLRAADGLTTRLTPKKPNLWADRQAAQAQFRAWGTEARRSELARRLNGELDARPWWHAMAFAGRDESAAEPRNRWFVREEPYRPGR